MKNENRKWMYLLVVMSALIASLPYVATVLFILGTKGNLVMLSFLYFVPMGFLVYSALGYWEEN